MKFSTPIALTLLICGLFASRGYSQASTREFVSGEGGYAFGIDSKPTSRKRINAPLGNLYVSGEMAEWKLENGDYVTTQSFFVSGANMKPTPAEMSAAVQGLKNIFLDVLKQDGAAVSEESFIHEKFKGVEIRSSKFTKAAGRMFPAGNRVFVTLVIFRDTIGFDEHKRTLDTFRLLTTQEYKDARLAESTPELLPQTEKPNTFVSDRAHNRLNGNVVKIVEEYQENPKAARELWSTETYDSDGNILKEISYHYGYPSEITVWGWIDKMRVSRSNHIEYALGEGPNKLQITEITAAAEPPPDTIGSGPPPAPKAADSRFETRYETVYNSSGQMIERKQYDNTGDLNRIEKTEYTPNGEKLVTNYLNAGWSSIEFILRDPAGNIVEKRSCDENGKKCDVEVYKYEFDSQKNWIVQRIFEKRVLNRKTIVRSGSVHYRKITYQD